MNKNVFDNPLFENIIYYFENERELNMRSRYDYIKPELFVELDNFAKKLIDEIEVTQKYDFDDFEKTFSFSNDNDETVVKILYSVLMDKIPDHIKNLYKITIYRNNHSYIYRICVKNKKKLECKIKQNEEEANRLRLLSYIGGIFMVGLIFGYYKYN